MKINMKMASATQLPFCPDLDVLMKIQYQPQPFVTSRRIYVSKDDGIICLASDISLSRCYTFVWKCKMSALKQIYNIEGRSHIVWAPPLVNSLPYMSKWYFGSDCLCNDTVILWYALQNDDTIF